jgi:hypothetical protein
VFWLGADLGVLLLARESRRAQLSFAERAFALRMAMLIDFTPRICFALMFPVGMHVATSGGYAQLPAWAFVLAWGLSLGWLMLLFALARSEGSPRAVTLNRAHLGLQGVLGLVIAGVGVASLLGHGPFPPGWLAAKVLLFAGIFGLGIGIDYAFRPIGPAFMKLATEGSTPATEATITRCVDGAIRYVLALYACLVAAAFLGVTKPF